VCSAGRYSGAGSSACDECNVGSVTTHFAVTGGATKCTACSAGKASAAPTSACVSCEAGKFSGAQATTCANCGVGSVTDTLASAGGTQCTACSAGKESAAPTSACTACEAGRHSGTGWSECTACEAGKKQASAGRGSCEKCEGASSEYQDAEGSTACKACAECSSGSRNGCGGAIEGYCMDCTPGRYTNTSSGGCVDCPAAYFQPESNKLSCEGCAICPAGSRKSCDSSFGGYCEDCTPGKFVKGGTCVICPSSYYQPDTNEASCIECASCPTGSRKGCGNSTEGFCSDCAPGTFIHASHTCSIVLGRHVHRKGQSGTTCRLCRRAVPTGGGELILQRGQVRLLARRADRSHHR
jgi:hypothetical protein